VKRSILSALAITVLVLSSIATADAAERKKPTWLASCPEVIDATPQLSTPKTMFLKSPSGQKFKLLEKDSVEFVREPQSIIGCYVFEENIINSNTNPPWQIGVVNRDLQGYYFKNQAGIVWRLTLNPKTLTLETAPGSTYYSPGAGFILDPVPQVASSLPVKPSTTPSAIKVGGSCPKIGQGQQVGTKVLICAKSKGKNLWRDATAAEKKAYLAINTPLPTVKPTLEPPVKPSATPTPTPTVTPITSATTGVANIRASAIANNTFYLDRGNCHSRGINAELQALEGATWKRLIGAMGWDEASNCDAAHPVQPWTAFDVPSGTTLRWRFWLTGAFDLNSATFMSLTKKVQAPTPTPTPTVSIKPTPTPSVSPTPSATVTRPPTVVPTVAPTPSAAATRAPTPTPIATPTVAPTPAQTNSSNQSTFLISNTNLTSIFNNFVTLTTSGGVGTGAVTFSVTGANCTINGNLLAANIVTKCSVTASKASSNGGNNTISQPVIFEFTAQPLILGYTTPNGLVGQTIYLTHTGGSGNGRVSYISDGTANCSVWDENGLTNGPSKLYIRSTIAGTCTVTAQKAESPGFPLAQSQPVTFTFGTVNQPPLTISSIPTTVLKVGDSFRLSATSSLTNSATNPGWVAAVTYSVVGEGCSIRTERVTSGGIISTISYVTSTSASNCIVTATSNVLGYNPQTSAPVSFPFGLYSQQPFSISSATTAFEGNLVGIASAGGSGTGAISFTVTGPNCSISGSNVTASAPTTCVVTGTKASKDGFSAITSQPISVVFQKVDLVDQQPLKIVGNFRLRAGELFLGQVSGGSGNGAVTYTVTGQNCFIPTSGGQAQIMVAASDRATCEIVVTKAASIGFKEAQTSTYMDFGVDNQAPISIKTDVSLTSVKGQFERSLGICNGCGGYLGITGGSGTGIVSYSALGSSCSVSGNVLTATEETTCTVTATKSASVGYNAVTSQPVSFNFRIRDSLKLFISNTVLTQKLPSTFTLGTYGGGPGNGAITYSTSSSGCSISGNQLSAADSSVARTCVVYATRAASTGYYPTTSDPLTFRFDLP